MTGTESILVFAAIVAVVIAAAVIVIVRKNTPDDRETESASPAPEEEVPMSENEIPADGEPMYVEAIPPPTGILLAGFPGIDIDVVVAVSIVDEAVVLESTGTGGTVGRIPVKDISKVILIDKSHEEYGVTTSRVLMIGVLSAFFPERYIIDSFFARITWTFEGTRYETVIAFDNAEWAKGFIDALNNERAGLS